MSRSHVFVAVGSLTVAVLTVHCSTFESAPADAAPEAAPSMDSSPADGFGPVQGTPQPDKDSSVVSPKRCDKAKPWGAPIVVPELSSASEDFMLTLTRDELTAFVSRSPSNGVFEARIAKRTSNAVAFSAPVAAAELAAINSSKAQGIMSTNSDGTVVYVADYDAGNYSIRVATRDSSSAPFGTPLPAAFMGPRKDAAYAPVISPDGQTLYGIDIVSEQSWQAPRIAGPGGFGARQDLFADPSNLFYVGAVSADGLTLYVNNGTRDRIAVIKRASVATSIPDAPTSFIEALSSIGNLTTPLWVSDDDCVLYLPSNRGGPGAKGGHDIFVSRRPK